MSQSLAAPLEARRRPKFRTRHIGPVRAQRSEQGIGIAHGQHLFRIGLPIRGEAQHASGAKLRRRRCNECGVDQAPLVMALLVPGVREEHQDLIEGIVRKLVLQYLDCIVTNDAQVAQVHPCGVQQ